ncbi:MFS transporter [Ktedonospora formicarum]|uniref:Putative metabolite transport protein YjhB n=1 Tax=Ktedonospora formicarum TaxID=2778364 RepID=A0A8J3HSW6_9CHLR|nr:MFS transporter [Ktedonospora formicarum]GHO42651.1 putative metabolite transport protein YjhB [Ktedonospora formicarum]
MTTDVGTQPWYKQLSGTQGRAFWAAWLGYALDGFDFVLITYALTNIAKDFQLTLVEASTLISAAFITRWLGGAVVGSIADKVGRKKAMIIGIWLYAVGTFLCGFSWNYWSLFAFRLIVGLGMAGEYSASATYVLESWPKHLRNRASAFLLSGYTVGSIIVSLIYPYIITHFSWRALFYLGIIPVFLTIYMRANLPESTDWNNAQKAGKNSEGVSFFRLLTPRWLPVFLVMTFFIFSAFMLSWPIQSLMPTYLKSIGYDPNGVGQVMFIANFGYLLGTIFSGFLGDWVGTRNSYIYMWLISLLLIIPVFIIGKSSILLLGILACLLQFTSSGISGLHPKYLAEHFAVDIRGVGVGVSYNVGALGGALAPIIGTLLAQNTSMGISLATLTFGWTLIAVLIVALNLGQRVSHQANEVAAEFNSENPAEGSDTAEIAG